MSPITIQIFRNAPILKVAGTFHLSQSREFSELIRYFLNSGRRLVVVDFSETDDIQSAGLAAVASACDQLVKHGGRLIAVVPANKSVQWHLEQTAFPGNLVVCATIEEALDKVTGMNGEVKGQLE